MSDDALVIARPEGLYCPAGDFFIDPWRPVDRAVLTHAHGDHARPGHATYLAAGEGENVLRVRLGDIALQSVAYAEPVRFGGVRVSLHPAGHVLGSAQVRIERDGQIWVVSGDYKVEADRTCTAFEPVKCDTFITESTFGLPIYRWSPQSSVFDEIDTWWRSNAEAGRTSVLFGYSFGKAQRILAYVDSTIGPIVVHGAVDVLNRAYRASGVELPPTHHVTEIDKPALKRALVIAPPSAQGSPWLRRFGDYSDAFASGWMQLRGARRRRALDRGFVLSDHADWPGLMQAIEASGARRVIVTHGQVQPMVRWLAERGYEAGAFATEFGDDAIDEAAAVAVQPEDDSNNDGEQQETE